MWLVVYVYGINDPKFVKFRARRWLPKQGDLFTDYSNDKYTLLVQTQLLETKILILFKKFCISHHKFVQIVVELIILGMFVSLSLCRIMFVITVDVKLIKNLNVLTYLRLWRLIMDMKNLILRKDEIGRWFHHTRPF